MVIKFFKKNLNSRGNILLSTILIMGLSLNIGLIIAVLTLSGLSRSSTLRSQTVAYYAAESGIESSLYKTRKGGQEIVDFSNEGANSPIDSTDWQVAGEIEAASIVEDLEQDQSLVLYLYNSENWASGIDSLNVTWQDTCQNQSQLEVLKKFPIYDQVEYDNLDWNIYNEYFYCDRDSQQVVLNEGTCILPLTKAAAYAIKIIARNCYVNYLKIEGKDNEDNIILLNLENVITSTGSSRDIKQTIRVSM